MGSVQSIQNPSSSYEEKTSKLGIDFQKSQLKKLRSSSTIFKSKRQMMKIGTFLNDKNFDFISDDNLDRVCFITVNTYHRPDFHLGVGPMNDAYIVAYNHHRRGYKIFFLHNSTRDDFLTYFKYFVLNTKKALTIFYAGRSTTLTRNYNIGDLNSNKIKAMVFEQGYVYDNEIGNILSNFKRNDAKIVLISDCCHGGPVWNLNSAFHNFSYLPENMISISVQNSDDISDYDKILITNDGAFTIFFWKISNDFPNITPKQLIKKIGPQLSKFSLSIVYHTSSKDLDTKPIFI